MSKETTNPISVTVEALVKAPVEKVWKTWNTPEDITKWCQASDDWHAPYAENDLRKGGKFKTTMAAKDGSFSFDFGGEYTNVETNKVIEYVMADGRKTTIVFTAQGNATNIVETFDAESENPVEFQQQGWQAILNNFKKYTESV
ncbi:MAG: SRPBCC family protein [Sporocytophaga sp.]|nr:SRPBCC family protein [Sporocytophaga sp.]